jgi:beta-galactosidase
LPEGVTAQLRTDGESQFIFLMNFKPEAQSVDLREETFMDLLTGETVEGVLELPCYGVRILSRSRVS